MILKMSQISALEGLREKFFSASFPLKTAYKVTRLFEAGEKEYNFYIILAIQALKFSSVLDMCNSMISYTKYESLYNPVIDVVFSV